MTKQYKYIKHKNIIDVAKAIHDKQHIFKKRDDDYFLVNIWADGIFPNHQYYKRVEVQEKTVECWAVVTFGGNIWETSRDETLLRARYSRHGDGFEIVKLTGTIEGVMSKADNKREYLVEDDRGHGGQLGV